MDTELTQLEKDAINLMVEDKVLFPALRKVVDKSLEKKKQEGIARLLSEMSLLTNEDAGAYLRGVAQGKYLVEAVFNELRTYEKEKEKELKVNRAR